MILGISNLLLMSTRELFAELLAEFPDAITDGEHYIYEPHGYEIPIMLVAHMDTVDDSVTSKPWVKQRIAEKNGVLYNEGSGVLGADDRAGVWAILRILQSRKSRGLSLPPVLFTNYEEAGGIGVAKFCKECDLPAGKLNLLIEIDREGNQQYVKYNDHDLEVDQYIESFGFNEQWGCYSDIADLTETFKIPSVNLSAGYLHQHTNAETLNRKWLNRTIHAVQKMLDNPIEKCYNVECYKWEGHYEYSYRDHEYDAYDRVRFDDNYAPRYYSEYDQDEAESILDSCTDPDQETCLSCGVLWWNCRCGAVAGAIAANMTSVQMKYLLDHFVFRDDGLWKTLTGLWEYYDDSI